MADTFVGGSETSTNAIGFGVKLLIENPDVWQKLKADPDKYLRTFSEEVLRLEGPVQGLFRNAGKDIELHGVTIPEGAMINIRYAAANRDERGIRMPRDARSGSRQTRAAPGLRIGHPPLPGRAAGPAGALLVVSGALVDRIDEMSFAPGGLNDFTIAPNFALRALRELHIEFKPAA